MKKKIAAVIALMLLICITATGCAEADQVSYNISKEADKLQCDQEAYGSECKDRYHSSGTDWNICIEEQF